MPAAVFVRFPADRPYAYYTRVFHFAESLWEPVVQGGLGTLHDLDHARETLRIDLAARRFAGEVKQIVRQRLKRHRLLEDATVTTE